MYSSWLECSDVKINSLGNFADKLIYDEYDNKILITNSFCDSVPNEYGEVIYEDEIEEE